MIKPPVVKYRSRFNGIRFRLFWNHIAYPLQLLRIRWQHHAAMQRHRKEVKRMLKGTNPSYQSYRSKGEANYVY